jgi:hypothetical protein
LILKHPKVLFLLALGLFCWGLGFLRGSFNGRF